MHHNVSYFELCSGQMYFALSKFNTVVNKKKMEMIFTLQKTLQWYSSKINPRMIHSTNIFITYYKEQ